MGSGGTPSGDKSAGENVEGGNDRAFRRYPDMVREGPAQPPPYPADKARGGEIILKTPGRRAVFIAGLVGCVLLIIGIGLLMH